MRNIKLTGREASLVRVMGFAEPMSGTEIQQNSSMTAEDLTDTLNSLISAGFVESQPYYEQVRIEAMPTARFEVNPSYAHQIKAALRRF